MASSLTPNLERHLTRRWPHLDASIPVRQRDRIPKLLRLGDPSAKDNQSDHYLLMRSTPLIYRVPLIRKSKPIIGISKRNGTRQSNFAERRSDLTTIPAQFQLPDKFRWYRMIHSHQAGKIASYRWSDLNFRHNHLLFSETHFNYSKTIYGAVIRNGMIQGGKDCPCVLITTKRN